MIFIYIVSKSQHGFLSNKSTFDAVSDVTDFIIHEFSNGCECLGIFLDLAKLFDA